MSSKEINTTAALETAAPTWWIRPGLEVTDKRMKIAGYDAETIAREHGTPLYVYDLTHIKEQVRRIQHAFSGTGIPFCLRFALKSLREPEMLDMLRGLGAAHSPDGIGMDVCSPGEMALALKSGWDASEISYTGTNLSDADFREILQHPIQINVDLLSQLRRIGRLAPGRKVGIRINPRTGAARIYVPAGRSPDEEHKFGMYAGAKPTKFGIYAEQLDEAIAIAQKYDLKLNAAHFHICHQTLTADLPRLDSALAEAMKMVRHLMDAGCPIEEVNTGGGIGQAGRQGEADLDLNAWAAILAKHIGPLGVTLASEPGEFLVSRSGVLLSEVVTVEDRMGTEFIGLNAGWNTMPSRFIWGEWLDLLPCVNPLAPRPTKVVVSGNINEAPDLFAEDYSFAHVREGDIVAIFNVGGYCLAAACWHCLRPPAPAIFFKERKA